MLLLLLLATLTAALPPIFPLCDEKLLDRYYIVYGPSGLKSGHGAEQITTLPYDLYALACGVNGMLPANITADMVESVIGLIEECSPPDVKQVSPTLEGVWIGTYEGLPKPDLCNTLFVDGLVYSSEFFCSSYGRFGLCELPDDPVETVSTTVTESETITEETTSLFTTFVVSTETLTDYYVTRVTTVITQGTSTLTTITTVSTCSTITRTFTSSCCPTGSDSFSSSSSSSSGSNCCPPNHHRRRDHHRRGCRDCDHHDKVETDDWKNAKLVKAPVAPQTEQQLYVECGYYLNNFHLVRANVNSGKANRATNINGMEACDYLEYNLANVTIPMLANLQVMFDACLTAGDNVVFNSYYAWTPFCGFVQYGPEGGVGMNDMNNAICSAGEWALCRGGPLIATTLTVPTGPFSTVTVEITQTETEVTTETIAFSETVTESIILTTTSTSFYPVTSTVSVPTTTTKTSTSITSCCCNPVVCTTVEGCCNHRPHGRHH